MGAWGTSLYANDTTCDIRGDYVDLLRRGNTNEEATQKLIEENRDIAGDMEEEPLFWFALADTQWNYGRLLPEVKEKALYFLDRKEELERWAEAGEKKLRAWEETRRKLKEKLLTPQPKEKRVSKYRLYRCQWRLGDVYAYQFSSDYSKEKGFWGQYIIFRKVTEDYWWPGHIVPVVQVYNWIGAEIPSLSQLKEMEVLEQGAVPITATYKPDYEREYVIILLSESQNVIPENNLKLLGNIGGEDLIPYRGSDHAPYLPVGWDTQKKYNRTFEKYIIDQYLAWMDYPKT